MIPLRRHRRQAGKAPRPDQTELPENPLFIRHSLIIAREAKMSTHPEVFPMSKYYYLDNFCRYYVRIYGYA
jgi:hypothetical protein